MEYDPAKAARDARRIATTFTLDTTPLDVEGLVSALGMRLQKLPLDERTSGFLRHEGAAWTVGVNSLHHPNRQRFTIAHEIGHFLLHRDQAPFEDGLLFRSDNQVDTREREANQFASLVLMPEDMFRQTVAVGGVDEAARVFRVSKQAAEYRQHVVESSIGID
jgi:hypothetical protein